MSGKDDQSAAVNSQIHFLLERDCDFTNRLQQNLFVNLILNWPISERHAVKCIIF